jgi:WD40 repeat protein
MIPNLDQEDICILEEDADLHAGKVSPNTVAKLLNDFSEQRTSAKRLKWIQGIAVVMFLLALTAAGFWWRATTAQHAAEEQARIANARRLDTESASVLSKDPQRGFLLAVEAVKIGQSHHGVRLASAEQWLREALGFAGGRVLVETQTAPSAVAISPDNRLLATGRTDGTAQLWDLSAKDPTASPVVLRGREDWVMALGISHDNRWLVTAGSNGTQLWDLTAKDSSAKPVVLDESSIRAVAISPDSHWLVTGSEDDNTARLWDLKDPAARPRVLRGHGRTVDAVAISPDSRWLVTGSADGKVRIWPLEVRDLIDLARKSLTEISILMNGSSIFQARSTARRFPAYRGQIRNADGARA